jgi:hypothetical protein
VMQNASDGGATITANRSATGQRATDRSSSVPERTQKSNTPPQPAAERPQPVAREGFVALTNSATGGVKNIKIGWSWTCFLFSGFFGLPLFLRGLKNWGFAMLGLTALNLFGSRFPALMFVTFPVGLALSVFVGLKANQLTISRYLDERWRLSDATSEGRWNSYMTNTDRIAAHRIIVGAAAVGGFLFALGLQTMIGEFGGVQLMQTASEMNRRLPIMIDRDTELSSTSTAPGTFIYYLRLVNMSDTDITADELTTRLRPNLVQAACSTPETRDAFLDRGVSLRYTYADRASRHIADIELTRSDCKPGIDWSKIK